MKILKNENKGLVEVSILSRVVTTDHLCVSGRFGPWLGGGGCDRCQEASVRHLGEDGEPGQQDGQHGGQRQDPGARGDLSDPEGARLRL